MTAPGPGVVLAIDFGSRTTVGVLTDSGEPRLVGVDGQPWIQSAVYADAGGLVVGLDAIRLARLDPTRFEPSPKRRIDEGDVLLGTEVVSVSTLIDAVIGRVVGETSRQLGGRPIEGLVLTHPAQWGNVRQSLLRQIGEKYARRLVLVPEPVAAAMYFAATTGFPVGAALAVYDLGAGTFDAAVVRRNPQGFEVLACNGIPDLGGIDMDERLFEQVGAKARAQNPDAWAELTGETTGSAESRRRLRSLRDDISSAKETLSRRVEIDIPFPAPFTDVHVTRAEYEDLIRADVERSVEVLAETIEASGQTPQSLHSIHFVGGATRTPLCGTLIEQRLGVRAVPIDQPETVVALGGARALLPAPGQLQGPSGRTGTYAATLGPESSAATGQRPPVGPPTGAVPIARGPGLPPGPVRPLGPPNQPPPPQRLGQPPAGRTGPPPHTRPVYQPAPQSHPQSGAVPRPQTGAVPRPPQQYGPPTGSTPAPARSRKGLYVGAAVTAVVVAIAAVLIVTLGGNADDNTAGGSSAPPAESNLSTAAAAKLVQKALPKDAVPDGYVLFNQDAGSDGSGYTKDPTQIDPSQAGYACIPQQDTPLPAEKGTLAKQGLNAIESGSPDRPRDQLVLNVAYVTAPERTAIVGQIRKKIAECKAEQSDSWVDYEYAPTVEDSGATEQVGLQVTLPEGSDDNSGAAVPETITTCQVARVEALVVRACGITTKPDSRPALGDADTGEDLSGTDRSAAMAAEGLRVVIAAAKDAQQS